MGDWDRVNSPGLEVLLVSQRGGQTKFNLRPSQLGDVKSCFFYISLRQLFQVLLIEYSAHSSGEIFDIIRHE